MFSIKALDSDRSVYMIAICYSVPIFAVSENYKLLGEQWMCVKFQIDISKTERLFCIEASLIRAVFRSKYYIIENK